MKEIDAKQMFADTLKEKPAILGYFSTEKCNVCKVLRPKIEALLSSEFPLMEMYYIDTEKFPEIAAQIRIFTVPTIVVFFDGQEFIRKSRNIGIGELRQELWRPYKLFFD
ncbi:MAG: thiol reductase thioredoxin [Draconibacterium sp.]|nr:MAG: thiol reductase thioredoxin [Draconibacterium sp.]